MQELKLIYLYLWAGGSRGDHVRLQEGTFKKDMVIIQSFVNRGENSLGNRRTFLDVMVTVSENFRFDDRSHPILLADYGVASQPLSVLLNRQLRRLGGADFQHRPPLGEPRAEVVESLSGGFPISSGELDCPLVHLDARNRIVFLENFHEQLAAGGFLVHGFFKEDDTGEVR